MLKALHVLVSLVESIRQHCGTGIIIVIVIFQLRKPARSLHYWPGCTAALGRASEPDAGVTLIIFPSHLSVPPSFEDPNPASCELQTSVGTVKDMFAEKSIILSQDTSNFKYY